MKKFIFVALLFLATSFAVAGENPKASIVGETKITYAPGVRIETTDFILAPGDTTLTLNTYGALRIKVTVRDSSDSMTDSVRAYMGTGNDTTFYSLVALHDCAQTTATTNVDIMNGTDATTKTYDVIPTDIRKLLIARLNRGTTAQGFLYPARTHGSVQLTYPLQ